MSSLERERTNSPPLRERIEHSAKSVGSILCEGCYARKCLLNQYEQIQVLGEVSVLKTNLQLLAQDNVLSNTLISKDKGCAKAQQTKSLLTPFAIVAKTPYTKTKL